MTDQASPSSDDSGIARVAGRLKSVRSAHRRGRHAEAHAENAEEKRHRKGVKKRLFEDTRVPSKKARLVEDADELAVLVERLKKPGPGGAPARFAYDTEFIGESSYFPKLCLIQVATADLVALVDPLADLDPTPLLELLTDPAIEKLVHAGEQDLEPVVRLTGKPPANVLDTQVAAGFVGLPYPASLTKLVEYVSGVVLEPDADKLNGLKLAKGYTFTQWDDRPLSTKQLAYAADDVRYLPLCLDWIDGQLDDHPTRRDWMRAECAERCHKASASASAEPADRIKGYHGLEGHQRPVLRQLARWRDAAAREGDLPPRALVKDEVLIHLAKIPPSDVCRLGEVRHMPRPVAEQFGETILAAIAAGRGEPADEVTFDFYEPSLADKFEADAAIAELQHLCYRWEIDPNLVANRREVERLLRAVRRGEPTDGLLLTTGWRREAVGDELVRRLGGKR